MIEVERDLSLVLHKPQHYHAEVITYERADDNGQFYWSTSFNLIVNDLTLAVDRAKKLSRKENAFIRNVTQCSDADHLKGIG